MTGNISMRSLRWQQAEHIKALAMAMEYIQIFGPISFIPSLFYIAPIYKQ
jgi:hypothetical protein